jgi:Mg-chelatase subunit ChlD
MSMTAVTNLETARVARDEARLSQNKAMLARLLANENITIIHDPKAVTAGFELQKRLLILPVWEGVDAVLYDLLVGHEVGHAKYTLEGEWLGAMEFLAKKHYGKSYKRAMPFVKNILNVLEDPRIEKLMKRLYPGLRTSFAAGYMQLWERDFFKVKALVEAAPHNAAQAITLAFTDRLNIHAKVGVRIGVYFADDELPFVARTEALETWDELVALADDIIKFLLDKKKDSKENEKQSEPEKGPKGNPSGEKSEEQEEGEGTSNDAPSGQPDEDDDGDAGDEPGGEKSEAEDGDEGEGSDASEKSESEDGEGEGEGSEASESEAEEEGEGDGESEEEGEAEGDTTTSSPTDEAERSDEEVEGASADHTDVADMSEEDIAKELGDGQTDKAFQEAAKSLAVTGVEWARVTAPTLKYEEFVHDFKRVMADHAKDIEFLSRQANAYHVNNRRRGQTAEYSKTLENATKWVSSFRASEKKNIAYMIKEFDLKKAAASHAREQTGKTGRLDMGKLHSYQYNDDVFRRSVIQHKGQSHGMVFILDFSGSMTDSIQKIVTSLISMSMFCRQANIPFDVYIFTDALSQAGDPYDSNQYNNFHASIRQDSLKSVDGSDIRLDKFYLRNLLSSRMSLREYNQALINLRLLAMGKLLSDRMGGTPLLGSIYLARDVVARFKDAHKLDVVSLMIMTDGDSNPVTDTVDGTLLRTMTKYAAKGYLTWHDKKTKRDRTEKVDDFDTYTVTRALQKMFLKDIKETFNANVIGYFITPCDPNKYSTTAEERASNMKTFREQGWVGVTAPGYDEFYMVKPSILEANQGRFSGAVTMPGADNAAEAFRKFAAIKNNSRTILRSLVHRICKQGI